MTEEIKETGKDMTEEIKETGKDMTEEIKETVDAIIEQLTPVGDCRYTLEGEPVYIVQSDVSQAFVEYVWKYDPIVAVDIETDGLDYKGNIGLITVYASGFGVELVHKPNKSLWNLRTITNNPMIAKVLHHAPFDMRFLMHWADVRFCNVYCTRMASRILDPKREYSHSLVHALDRHLDVSIPKGQALSDWFTEALTDEQIEYAVNDVRYLEPLLLKCTDDLIDKGIYAAYRDSCDYLPSKIFLELLGITDVYGR